MNIASIGSFADPNLLVGTETNDDAAVYKLTDDVAVVLTCDFFTPIVDEPYDFGRVAAANALSDIYAMGAEPRVALNLTAFPKALGLEVTGDVLRGAADVCREAGVLVAGGHTIEDSEPKFGLSVMGVVNPSRLLRNAGARPGDVLFLTKAVGTGLVSTGLKRGVISEDEARPAIESMATLNAAAGNVVRAYAEKGFVHACTDLTGFALAGHVHEMCEASGCSAAISFERVPLLPHAFGLAQNSVMPGKTRDIKAWAEEFVTVEVSEAVAPKETILNIVCDPQTSGGLLVAITPEAACDFEVSLREARVPITACIGTFEEGEPLVRFF